MNDSIGLYLKGIGKVPLLTAEDERQLSQLVEAGREAAEKLANGKRDAALQVAVGAAAEAKDRFIRANLRLVVSIAKRYPLPHGMDLLDLIQEGNLGLEHAVDKFDWRMRLQILDLRHILDPSGRGSGARPEGQPDPHPRRTLGQPAAPPCVRPPARARDSLDQVNAGSTA